MPLPLLLNQGNIGRLYLYNTDPGEDELLVNEGTIDKLTKGIESINAGKEMLSSLQSRADDLRIALQEFVDEYDN